MRLLVMGGSVFVGRTIVQAAVGRGWIVTTFNLDGDAVMPNGTEHLVGDRTKPDDLAALRGRKWDAVIDTWAGRAEAVRASAALTVDAAAHYIYVSSLVVFRRPIPCPLTETAALLPVAQGGCTAGYPARKVAAERAVGEIFGPRALVVRPGLIFGPHERPGRLPRWLLRLAGAQPSEQVLAPGGPGRTIQYVDARDLAEWLLDAAAGGLEGAYNIASPPGHATMGGLLDTCRAATGSAADLIWVDETWLARAGVRPWTELPVWILPTDDSAAIYNVDASKALAAGMAFRPLAETVDNTWRWLRQLNEYELGTTIRRDGWLTPQREARLLGSWLGGRRGCLHGVG